LITQDPINIVPIPINPVLNIHKVYSQNTTIAMFNLPFDIRIYVNMYSSRNIFNTNVLVGTLTPSINVI